MSGIYRVIALALGMGVFPVAVRKPALGGERPRLYGIKKIAVAVRADPDGDLDGQKLRAEVVSKLRGAGLRVDNGSRSHLDVVVGVSTIRSESGLAMGFAYSVHLCLTQQVYLANNPNRLTEAVTWQTMSLGTASNGELGARCERTIARKVEEFVSVYLEGAE